MRRASAVIGLFVASTLLVSGALSAQEPSTSASQVPHASQIKRFTITLVLGDTQAGASDVQSPGAKKALDDLKDFLPYKKYRTLDTAPILGANGPHIMLRGLMGEKYEFYMGSKELSPTMMQVDTLRLWSTPGKSPAMLLIDTSFKMNVGETVVVGTSRFEDPNIIRTLALILLVTWVQ